MRAEESQTSIPVSRPESPGESGWFDREVAWLRTDAQKARWVILAIFCILILYLIALATFATGPVNVFHNDPLWMLDNGWRVLNGQVPHRDFYSPLGPLEYGILAGGMLLAKGGAQGLAIGFAGFALLIGIWGWLLSRKRLPAPLALLGIIWLVFAAVSPTPLGFTPEFLSCAMIHNREAYALLGLILIECSFARRNATFWSGLSSGAALILLAFLKLNFFGVAGLMLLASVPVARVELPRLWGALAGAAGTFLGFSLYPRFSLLAFFSDMGFVARAHAPLTLAATIAGTITCAKAGAVWLVLAMIVAIIAIEAPVTRWRRQTLTLTALTFIVLASGPLFVQMNSLENRCQLAPLLIIILLDPISIAHSQTKNKLLTVVLVGLSIGSIATALIPNFISTFNLLSDQSQAAKAGGARIAASGMENVRFYNSTSFYDHVEAGDGDGTYYANCVNDGLTLLENQSRPTESVLVLGFINPFSYLLRRKPAEGGSSFLFLTTSITENHMPPVDRVFGNADLMMLPEYEGTHRASDQFIQDYYRSYLLENFHFVAKSQRWSLYRRNRSPESH